MPVEHSGNTNVGLRSAKRINRSYILMSVSASIHSIISFNDNYSASAKKRVNDEKK